MSAGDTAALFSLLDVEHDRPRNSELSLERGSFGDSSAIVHPLHPADQVTPLRSTTGAQRTLTMAAAPTTSRLLSRFAFPPATHTFAPQSRDQASRTFSSIASQRSSPTPCARCFSTALRSRPTGSTESDQRSLSVAGASRRHLHSLPPLPGAISTEAGCQPFLSSETVQLIGTIWQGGLLQRLNDEVKSE